MEWLYVVAGFIVFIVILGMLTVKGAKEQTGKRLRMEDAYRKWKISAGLDGRYDEHGRLRK